MSGRIALIALAGLALTACQPGAKSSQQTGYRGTGMDQIADVSAIKAAVAIPAPVYALPPDGGPTAAQTYKNVQVLGNVSSARFDHLMAQISQWVAPPEQGCNYCHNPANLASDEKYTKIVARRMLQMTRNINTRWASHVQGTGVTCYTCHRGAPVPQFKWAVADQLGEPGTITGNKRGQNTPDANIGFASLPYDPFDHFLRARTDVRVVSKGEYPLRGRNGASIKDAEATYGLMMHISTALGVNCTFCHNTQSMGSWPLSRQQRVTAYYGIRMVREINDDYISSLAAVFPANRKGAQGDPYKVNCSTCHQGLSKPLGGQSMLALTPDLKGPPTGTAQDVGGRAAQAATIATFRNPAAANAAQQPAPGTRTPSDPTPR